MPNYLTPLFKYASIRGRATRSEFFGFAFSVILAMSLALGGMLLADANEMTDVGTVFMWAAFAIALVAVVPMWALGVRRMHDRGLSGWWQLLTFVPLIGGLLWLVLTALRGTHGHNQYGPDPELSEIEAQRKSG